jgi:hypothetical protein
MPGSRGRRANSPTAILGANSSTDHDGGQQCLRNREDPRQELKRDERLGFVRRQRVSAVISVYATIVAISTRRRPKRSANGTISSAKNAPLRTNDSINPSDASPMPSSC